jgi:hypothetical protein
LKIVELELNTALRLDISAASIAAPSVPEISVGISQQQAAEKRHSNRGHLCRVQHAGDHSRNDKMNTAD